MRSMIYSIRNYPEHLRFKLYPKLAEYWLNWSCRKAVRQFSGQEHLKILVDTCVLGHAITHESKWICTSEFEWNNEIRHTGYVARVPVHSRQNDTDDYRDLCYLTGIAHLARKGVVTLFTSAELEEEQLRQPAGRYRGYGYFDYSLFHGLRMESVDGSVEEIMTGAWSASVAAMRQRQRIAASGDALYESLHERLKHQLGPKKASQDAWHVRTAEKHGMLCFLTMDRPLLNACRQLAKRAPLNSLNAQIMSPTDLGKYLRVGRVPPDILSYNNASWFVRRDHVMPGQKRRPLKHYGS